VSVTTARVQSERRDGAKSAEPASGPPASPSLFTRLDERFSGLTILLAGADLAAFGAAAVMLWPIVHWVALFAVIQVVSRATARVYRRRLRLSYFDDVPRVLAGTAAGLGLGAVGVLLLGSTLRLDPAYVGGAAAFLLASEVLRCLVFQLARWARRRYGRGERTVVLGATELGTELARCMIEHPDFGLRPIGFVDAAPLRGADRLPLPWLGNDIATVVREHRIQTVLLSFSGSRDVDLVDAALAAHRMGCSMLVVPRMYELYHDAADVERLRSYPLVRLSTDPTKRPSWIVKRAGDVIFGLVGLVLLSPVLLMCAAATLIESGRPILFRQQRIGLDGRPFHLHKLRSLTPAQPGEEQTTWNVAGDPRIGRVGRFLRRTSLDELPQLWNIVRGDMSLVGPRPERPGFVVRFSGEHARYWARHRVPSGLTGLAQVTGLRGDTSIADRARYDNYYIANWSIWLDVKILLLTARELVRRGDH